MTMALEQRRRSCWTEEFWGHHCEGFRVEGPHAFIGVVDGVRRSPEGDIEALLVWQHGALQVVPAVYIESVDEWRELITVRQPPALQAVAGRRRGREG
jgi:hypothetical protein